MPTVMPGYQPAIDPDVGPIVDRAEMEHKPPRRSAGATCTVRRYQTRGWYPGSPIPLALDSGGNGTITVRSNGSARSNQHSSSPTSASS